MQTEIRGCRANNTQYQIPQVADTVSVKKNTRTHKKFLMQTEFAIPNAQLFSCKNSRDPKHPTSNQTSIDHVEHQGHTAKAWKTSNLGVSHEYTAHNRFSSPSLLFKF
jgi:hypothetical protein